MHDFWSLVGRLEGIYWFAKRRPRIVPMRESRKSLQRSSACRHPTGVETNGVLAGGLSPRHWKDKLRWRRGKVDSACVCSCVVLSSCPYQGCFVVCRHSLSWAGNGTVVRAWIRRRGMRRGLRRQIDRVPCLGLCVIAGSTVRRRSIPYDSHRRQVVLLRKRRVEWHSSTELASSYFCRNGKECLLASYDPGRELSANQPTLQCTVH